MSGNLTMMAVCLVIMGVVGCMGTAHAASVYVYADAAPNVYGSPEYEPWLDAAYAAVANGTFANMANSSNPANVGTTDFTIYNEVGT